MTPRGEGGGPETPLFRKNRSIPSCALGPPGIKSGSLGNYKGTPKNGTFCHFLGFSGPPRDPPFRGGSGGYTPPLGVPRGPTPPLGGYPPRPPKKSIFWGGFGPVFGGGFGPVFRVVFWTRFWTRFWGGFGPVFGGVFGVVFRHFFGTPIYGGSGPPLWGVRRGLTPPTPRNPPKPQKSRFFGLPPKKVIFSIKISQYRPVPSAPPGIKSGFLSRDKGQKMGFWGSF